MTSSEYLSIPTRDILIFWDCDAASYYVATATAMLPIFKSLYTILVAELIKKQYL